MLCFRVFMHARYYLHTLAGGGFGIRLSKTQTRRRGAILADLQRLFVKPCRDTITTQPHEQINSKLVSEIQNRWIHSQWSLELSASFAGSVGPMGGL